MPDPTDDAQRTLQRRWVGAISTFVGTFLAAAGANYSMFAIIELFDGEGESEPYEGLLVKAGLVSSAGIALYLIGRKLRPGAIYSVGMVLTAIAVLWIAFAGVCFFRMADHLGVQRAMIALASMLAALLAAIGQTIRN